MSTHSFDSSFASGNLITLSSFGIDSSISFHHLGFRVTVIHQVIPTLIPRPPPRLLLSRPFWKGDRCLLPAGEMTEIAPD